MYESYLSLFFNPHLPLTESLQLYHLMPFQRLLFAWTPWDILNASISSVCAITSRVWYSKLIKRVEVERASLLDQIASERRAVADVHCGCDSDQICHSEEREK